MLYVNYIVWIAKMQFQHSKEWNKLNVVIKLTVHNGVLPVVDCMVIKLLCKHFYNSRDSLV